MDFTRLCFTSLCSVVQAEIDSCCWSSALPLLHGGQVCDRASSRAGSHHRCRRRALRLAGERPERVLRLRYVGCEHGRVKRKGRLPPPTRYIYTPTRVKWKGHSTATPLHIYTHTHHAHDRSPSTYAQSRSSRTQVTNAACGLAATRSEQTAAWSVASAARRTGRW